MCLMFSELLFELTLLFLFVKQVLSVAYKTSATRHVFEVHIGFIQHVLVYFLFLRIGIRKHSFIGFND